MNAESPTLQKCHVYFCKELKHGHVHVRQEQTFLPVALGMALCISATCGVKICNESAKSSPVSFLSKTKKTHKANW